MEWYWAIGVLLGSILILMMVGLPVGIAFLTVNMVAAIYYLGGSGSVLEQAERGIGALGANAFESMANFALVPIPMFLLMGELFFHTELATRMFNAVEKLMGRIPARLSYVTVAGGTAFATLSGSSMGSTALLGTLMVPEMTKRGYKKSMSIGPILGTGGLAMLIPPSALAVLLGTLAELDIGKLLIAGVIPGLILATMYAVLIYVRTKIDPEAAPAYDIEYIPWWRRLAMLGLDVVPMVSIVGGVIALIMGGFATPSEAAAFGCLGVVILAIIYIFFPPVVKMLQRRHDRRAGGTPARRDGPYWIALLVYLVPRLALIMPALAVVAALWPVLFLAQRASPGAKKWIMALHFWLHEWTLFERSRFFGQATWKSLMGAARVTVMAMLILFGSSTFSQILAFSGGSNGLIVWVTSFEVTGTTMLLMMFGILLILGMFMDQLAMMMLTVPIFFPLAAQFGFDPIWFGMIILLALEISFTTPPFGLLLFVMQGVAPPGTRFSEICLAAIPYMLCAMVLVALVIIFPGIATWLPSVKF